MNSTSLVRGLPTDLNGEFQDWCGTELPEYLEDFPTIIDEDSTVNEEELPDDLEDFPTIIDDGELAEGELSNNAIECFPVDIMEEFIIRQLQQDNSSEIPDDLTLGEIDGEVTILPYPLPGHEEIPTVSEGEIDGEVTILPYPLPDDEENDLLIGNSNGEEFPTLSETDGEIIELPFEFISFNSSGEGGELPEIIPCFVGYDPMISSSNLPLTEQDLRPVI
ncbi:MAG: hypothetical protein VKK42_01270 [Lyngbya sp.]|nr:hypothetical protein [Lyngbya sp.]